ncbi:hypothetical protein [Cyclobacterium jeungdonense]|uniref:Uncharacterized protein n=1 Tax=Cyclobacterium jeungdonense TaxID=708087 RepID=A0ABT8C8W3_9BACT|nr:hypothetical protein [Cyclobacterium jeungdonense]MDN3688976.1 hypothetical protein [Cyclobacterium jeungdonense]
MFTKNIITILTLILITAACSSEKEDRYIYETDRVLDSETGDEYYFKNLDTMTVVHIDGVSEPVTVSSTPFAGSEAFEKMMTQYQKNLEAREDSLLMVKKEQIKQNRMERYAEYSDDELMERFNNLKEVGGSFTQQMDVMAELVRREVVLEIDVPEIMEIDPADIDMDVDYQPEEEN